MSQQPDSSPSLAAVAKPTCLVIYALGADDTPAGDAAKARYRAIESALKDSFSVYKAEDILVTGDIARQSLKAILDADLVVADLTVVSPSVMYELALCHLVAQPVIQLQVVGEETPSSLPVYARNQRTVQLDLANPQASKKQMTELAANVGKLQSEEISPLTTELRSSIASRLVSSLPPMIEGLAGAVAGELHERRPLEPSPKRPTTRAAMARVNAIVGEATATLDHAAALRSAADAVEDDALQRQLLESAARMQLDAALAIRSVT